MTICILVTAFVVVSTAFAYVNLLDKRDERERNGAAFPSARLMRRRRRELRASVIARRP